MLGWLILLAGGVLMWAALTGKGSKVLSALSTDLTKFNPNAGIAIGGGGASSSKGQVGQFTGNLPGGGSVTVNASDPSAAATNINVETGQNPTSVRSGGP